MDFDLPADDDPRRIAVREWLDAHPDPTNADLHEGGYIVPHWPAPFGLDADPMHQLIIDDELKRAGVTRTSTSTNAIGVGWAARVYPCIGACGCRGGRGGLLYGKEPKSELRGAI